MPPEPIWVFTEQGGYELVVAAKVDMDGNRAELRTFTGRTLVVYGPTAQTYERILSAHAVNLRLVAAGQRAQSQGWSRYRMNKAIPITRRLDEAA